MAKRHTIIFSLIMIIASVMMQLFDLDKASSSWVQIINFSSGFLLGLGSVFLIQALLKRKKSL